MSDSPPKPLFLPSVREYGLVAATIVIGVVAVVLPVARVALASAAYAESRGLTPTSDPISTTIAPLLFSAVGIGLLLAAAGVLLGIERRTLRRIAVAAAGLKAGILALIGGGLLLSAFAQPPNTDGLFGLALFFLGAPLLAAALVYVGVAFMTRARGLPWRVVAAAVDGVIVWVIAENLLLSGVTHSQPYITGSALNPVQTPAQNGSWPLVQAGFIALLLFAGTLPVVINAIRTREPVS